MLTFSRSYFENDDHNHMKSKSIVKRKQKISKEISNSIKEINFFLIYLLLDVDFHNDLCTEDNYILLDSICY